MKSFVVESPLKQRILVSSTVGEFELNLLNKFGWGNGYVVLEKTHPWYGYDDSAIPVDVHGGITYAKIINEDVIKNFSPELDDNDLGKFIIGFDTAHYNSGKYWTEERVREETEDLLRQCYK